MPPMYRPACDIEIDQTTLPGGALPFPLARAQAIETPHQRLRRIHEESDRRIDILAERLGCLGWFDHPPHGPRAA